MGGALAGAVAGGSPAAINGALPGGGQPIGANWALGNAGTYNIDGAGVGNWVVPTDAPTAALFDVMVTVTGGAFTAGAAVSTWLNMGTTRTWTRVGSGVVTFTVQFRIASTLQVVSSQAGVTVTVP